MELVYLLSHFFTVLKLYPAVDCKAATQGNIT